MFALVLLLCGLSFQSSETPITLAGPTVRVGDELIYRGTILEASEHVAGRFRKKHDLEIYLLVLETRSGSCDCAVMTKITTWIDPAVADPAESMTGRVSGERKPAVSLKLIRLDNRGRVMLLDLGDGPPPLLFSAESATSPPPPMPLNMVPEMELGMVVPLPRQPVTLGTQWETTESKRPPIVWTAQRESTWNGARSVQVRGIQQTDAWARPLDAVAGWQRAETLWVTQSTGLASRVERKITRREGSNIVGWIEVNYELQPMNRYVGPRFADARQEVELAFSCDRALETLLTSHRHSDAEFASLQARIDRHLQARPVGSAYAEALHAVRRRCVAAADGAVLAPIVFPKSKEDRTPNVPGRPAPDFLAPRIDSSQQFRLLGKPTVPRLLIFYKPSSETTPGTLAVAQALQDRFGSRTQIIAAAIGDAATVARTQHQKLKLSIPLVDGRAARSRYGVLFHPQFFVIDADGNVAAHQEGFGPETGYLLKEEMETLLDSRK